MESGDVLAGRYRLVDHLGHGGMSDVWRGFDEVLDRDVAVKVLSALAVDPARDGSIRAEAQAAAKLAHPNLVNVFDYGVVVSDDQPVPFIVMELLEGTTLRALAAEGPLEPAVAIRACAEVAGALAEAHAHGLVHRDVKPGNIMMTAAGAKVFDFGIAVSIGTFDESGPTSALMGTPSYIAPERIMGAAASPASDVYALGILIYRLLTHEYPFRAATTEEVLVAHVGRQPYSLPALPGVADAVRQLYLRCLAKDPGDRPSAQEAATVLAFALAPPTGLLGTPARPVAMAAGGEATEPVAPGRPRRSASVAVAAFGAVFLVALGLTTLFNRTTPTEAAPSGEASPMPSATSAGSSPVAGTAPPAPTTVTVTVTVTGGVPATAAGPPRPDPGPRTFTSTGGVIVADCYQHSAHLLSWQPDDGYRVKSVVQGPAPEAVVVFKLLSNEIRMAVTCPADTPVLAF